MAYAVLLFALMFSSGYFLPVDISLTLVVLLGALLLLATRAKYKSPLLRRISISLALEPRS